MNVIRAILDEHPVMESMEPAHLDVLAKCGRKVNFKKGELIFREGEPANRFYLVLEGKVAVEAHEAANGTILVEELRGGELLGWSWLFAPFVWHFQARALADTELVAFDGAHLLVVCEKDTRFGLDLMRRITQVLIHRLMATRRRCLEGMRRQASPAGESSSKRGAKDEKHCCETNA